MYAPPVFACMQQVSRCRLSPCGELFRGFACCGCRQCRTVWPVNSWVTKSKAAAWVGSSHASKEPAAASTTSITCTVTVDSGIYPLSSRHTQLFRGRNHSWPLVRKLPAGASPKPHPCNAFPIRDIGRRSREIKAVCFFFSETFLSKMLFPGPARVWDGHEPPARTGRSHTISSQGREVGLRLAGGRNVHETANGSDESKAKKMPSELLLQRRSMQGGRRRLPRWRRP